MRPRLPPPAVPRLRSPRLPPATPSPPHPRLVSRGNLLEAAACLAARRTPRRWPRGSARRAEERTLSLLDGRPSFAGRTLRLTRPRGRDRGGVFKRSEKVRTHPHTSTHHHRHSMPAARSARSPVMYWSLSCGTLCPYLAPRRLSWAASAGPIYCASHPLATV